MEYDQTRAASGPLTDAGRHPVESATHPLPPGAIPTAFLFQGTQEVLINHNGEHYRLRITKNGKLILTK
ncbi:MAG: hemin uptake protein HemP [Hydrogenophilales bacterium 12-61-10]|nr:MAG: hemin uptake protein HemP [Hydrogenophilales bacterium 12-61-10]OYX29078.1 MAG: hemin uptake protein HemP [Hydrogenophilales bacterium 32-62-9]